MSRKPKEPPDTSSLRQATATFTKQTDRGSALVAAAWVDDALDAYLRAFFRPDKKLVDEILQSEGALGTFSSRIKITYLLGLIDSNSHNDLEIIRGIRNDFAHVRQQIRFTDQSIKDRCKRLHAAKAFQLGTGTTMRSPREMFLISAYFLGEYLLSLAENTKPPRMMEIDYGVPIRRFAKSMTLREIMLALESLENRSGG